MFQNGWQFQENREVMTNTFVINQKIGNTDLGRFDSLKNIIKNPMTKQLMVVAWKVVVITLIPIYCKTALYNPNFTNKGSITSGSAKNIHHDS